MKRFGLGMMAEGVGVYSAAGWRTLVVFFATRSRRASRRALGRVSEGGAQSGVNCFV